MKMDNIDFLLNFTTKVCEIGCKKSSAPQIYEIDIFKSYFQDKKLKIEEIDEFDGKYKRREILARYLLLNAVLDQGPDIVGVRELLKNVINQLYRQEIRILHTPIEFFKEIGITIDEIIEKHKEIKEIRKHLWAKEMNSNPSKYNLFFTQSPRGIVSIKQVLDYVIHRWGVPLCCFLIIEKDLEKQNKISSSPFVDWIESFKSAEFMAREIKDNERYGLGSAIGDKACHLFAKFYVSVFKLISKKDDGWSDISYEIPFDSNVGRVLWRTGFLLSLAEYKDYVEYRVIREKEGKRGTNYLRITNIRGKEVKSLPKELEKKFKEVVKKYLKVRIRKVEIQKIPNLLIYLINEKKDCKFSIANFDDGLIQIGTNYCFNHDKPNCEECPVKEYCRGYNKEENLIKNYTT